MARKEITVTIDQDGDDKGKVFVIQRMSAFDADRWGRRVLNALVQNNARIPDIDEGSGLAGVAQFGIKLMAYIDPDRSDELLGHLIKCVMVRPDPQNPIVLRPVHESDIDDVRTIAVLREEAFKLHTDFFMGVGRLFSPVGLAIRAAMSGASQNTPMSPPPSAS